jgi:hypothetical protein
VTRLIAGLGLWLGVGLLVVAATLALVQPGQRALADRPLAPVRVAHHDDGAVSVTALCGPTRSAVVHWGPPPDWLADPDFYGRCPQRWYLHQTVCVRADRSREIQRVCYGE